MGQDRTPKQWFAVAERCYTENHQGCAWCGGSYRVYHMIGDEDRSFQCNQCDFQVGYNENEQRYYLIPGEVPKDVPVTMHET